VFEAFIERNNLLGIALSKSSDDRIANAFLRADMPFEVLGELHNLVENWKTPLAIPSSGLLEDTTRRPFAGVYVTKMIPNNQANINVRLQKLLEAVKFVWASTYFKIAKDYCKATQLGIESEKMAVIIQEVIGRKHGSRFYPDLSGVLVLIIFYHSHC
jgi:phosphoenolpyruvate synthase/pyruvate phosphate dikinase